MTRNKKNKKVIGDGKAIAALEASVHNLKKEVAAQSARRKGQKVNPSKSGRKPREAYGAPGSPLEPIVSLMGNQEQAETIYLSTLADCEEVQGPIPATQTVGYVPTDLWLKTLFYDTVTGTAAVATVAIEDDRWNSGDAVGSYGLLTAGSDESSPVTATQSNYASASFPANYTLLPTGATAIVMDDVSDSFVSNANSGTEYIQVASVTHLQCKMTPSANAADAFVGTVAAIFTTDPETHPIMGKTIEQIKDDAALQDSKVVVREFHITRDGLFVPVNGLHDEWFGVGEPVSTNVGSDGEPVNVLAYSTIRTFSIPIHDDCYEWRRIGAVSLQTKNNTVNLPSQGLHIYSPVGTRFSCRTSYLYQTETYESAKVRPTIWDGINAIEHATQGIGSSPIWQTGQYPGNKKTMTAHIRAKIPIRGTIATKPSKDPRSPPPVTPLRSPMPRITGPPSIVQFRNHVLSRIGFPVHPLVPHACVIANRCASVPGFHAQLSAATPRQLANFLPVIMTKSGPRLHPLAAAMVSAKGGVNAAGILDSDWDWQKILSTMGNVALDVIPLLLKAF